MLVVLGPRFGREFRLPRREQIPAALVPPQNLVTSRPHALHRETRRGDGEECFGAQPPNRAANIAEPTTRFVVEDRNVQRNASVQIGANGAIETVRSTRARRSWLMSMATMLRPGPARPSFSCIQSPAERPRARTCPAHVVSNGAHYSLIAQRWSARSPSRTIPLRWRSGARVATRQCTCRAAISFAFSRSGGVGRRRGDRRCASRRTQCGP